MDDFYRIKRLPPYVFTIVNDLKTKARARGEDPAQPARGAGGMAQRRCRPRGGRGRVLAAEALRRPDQAPGTADVRGLLPYPQVMQFRVSWQRAEDRFVMPTWEVPYEAGRLEAIGYRGETPKYSTQDIMGLFVLSLIPISVAYHVAHYLYWFFTQIQFGVPAASDPPGDE